MEIKELFCYFLSEKPPYAIRVILLFLLYLLALTFKEYCFIKKWDSLTRKEQLYIIDEEGIFYALGGSFAQHPWKAFRKIQEYKDFYNLP